jgi:undecaprenyl-diphosphatase
MDKSATGKRIQSPWLWVALVVGTLAAALYDAPLTAWLATQTAARPGLDTAARLISDWGCWVFYAAFGLAGLVGLVRGDKALLRLSAGYLLTLLIFSAAAGHVLKIAVGRPRPWLGVGLPRHPFSLQAAYNSFPSGHTTDAFSAAVPVWRWVGPSALKWAALLLATLIGVSRVMLNQHYATDVIAGAAMSLLGGLLVVPIVEHWLPEAAAVPEVSPDA